MIRPIEDFASPTDPPGSWQNAVHRAQDDAIAESKLLGLSLPPTLALSFLDTVYECSDSIRLKIPTLLVGTGGGMTNAGTVLYFPKSTGIISEWPANNQSGPPGHAGYSVIERLKLAGPSPSKFNATCNPMSPTYDPSDAACRPENRKHGVVINAKMTLRDVGISGFDGHGIYMNANVHANPASNANLWRVEHCRIELCAGDGVHVSGPDANAGYANAVDASACLGWGIRDLSPVGNVYTACHVDSCWSGGYTTATRQDGNGVHVFVGCYQEGKNPKGGRYYSEIHAPSLVIGGILGMGFAGDGAGLSTAGFQANFLNGVNVDTGEVTMRLGGMVDPLTAFEFYDNGPPFYRFDLRYGHLDPRDPSVKPYTWRKKGWWSMVWANGAEPGPFAFAVGKTQAIQLGIPEDDSMFWLPHGTYMGTNLNRIRIPTGTAKPTTPGTKGDIVFNSAPSSNGFVGWVCLTDGTWRDFGKIV